MMEPLKLTDHKAPVLAWISPAQRDLLLFFREKMRFGKAEILTSDGEPVGTKEPLASVKFGR